MTTYNGALGRRITRQGFEARRLMEVCPDWDLNEWEMGFIDSVAGSLSRGFYPSNRQTEVLNRIVEANGTTWAQISTEARAIQTIQQQEAYIRRINARGYGSTARAEAIITQAREVLN
jgi:hypothetical protein